MMQGVATLHHWDAKSPAMGESKYAINVIDAPTVPVAIFSRRFWDSSWSGALLAH
jgi:hypothetical protein